MKTATLSFQVSSKVHRNYSILKFVYLFIKSLVTAILTVRKQDIIFLVFVLLVMPS